MSWVRLDDTLDDHPKVAGCSDRAFRVWIRCIFYANRCLTDGEIPRAVWKRLGVSKRVLGELVAAGLLDPFDAAADSVTVHDYLQFQESRAKVEARREATRQRVAKHREGRTVTALPTAPVTPLVTPTTSPNITVHTTGGSFRDAREAEAIPPPAHGVKCEESFWQGVESWAGPSAEHEDYCRQNGLDLGNEAFKFRAHQRKLARRCADWGAAFDLWLGQSLTNARQRTSARAEPVAVELPHERKERERLGEARRKRIAQLKAEGKMP